MELRCNLLAPLLDDVAEARKLTVFDAGSATPETVEFFSRYKCRLHFADLYSAEALACVADELDENELVAHFHRQLGYPATTKFDLCLLWDVLNYLSEPALTAFTKVLSGYSAPDTRIHGFATLKPTTPLPNQGYSIRKTNVLKARKRPEAQFPRYPHSQLTLNHSLSGMKIKKVTLLVSGLLEMSLKSTS